MEQETGDRQAGKRPAGGKKAHMSGKKEHRMSLAFGGQAVIEGVLMRSRNFTVVCVRTEDGKIQKSVERLDPADARHKALGYPLIRGIYALFETMYVGIKALYKSANMTLEEEGEQIKPGEMAATVAFAVILAILFFAVIPFFATQWLNVKGLVFNVIEGVIRLVIFLIYIALISLAPQFRRVLQYHGAEHTAINIFEAGKDLQAGSAVKGMRLHPRCGTSFIIIVLVMSILIFSVMPDMGMLVNFSYRILFIPVIGGLSYEVLKFSDRHKDSGIMKALVAPGVWLQRLTTKEPTGDMVEVALEAVREVVRLEGERARGFKDEKT